MTNFYTTRPIKAHALSAAVGSGKTRAAIAHMARPANASRNYIYVAPTIELGTQTTESLRATLASAVGPVVRNVHLINSKTVEGKARSEALRSVNEVMGSEGCIVILTTQTFLDILAGITRPGQWNVILDEAFSPATFDTFPLGKDIHKDWEYFSEVFDVVPEQGYRIVPKAGMKDTVGALADGRFNLDKGRLAGLTGIAKAVSNPASRCELVASARVQALINGEPLPPKRGKAVDSDETTHVLEYASYISPDYFGGFREVLFLSALFEQTVLYHLWTKALGVTFQEHPEFPAELLRDTHGEQARFLAVGHLLNKDDTSSRDNLGRNLLTGQTGEKVQGQRVLDHLVRTASAHFEDAKFLLQTNVGTGYEEGKSLLPSNAIPIPMFAHGLNKWQDIDNVVALGVTNPNPQQLAWTKERTGLNSKQVTQAFRIHTIYQALGRCAIRNAEQTSTPKTVLTSGVEDAKFLHNLFKGSLWLGQVGNLPSVRVTASREADKEDGKTVALSKLILEHLEALKGIDRISSRSLRESMNLKDIGTLSLKVQMSFKSSSDKLWSRAVYLACSLGSGWKLEGRSIARVTAETHGFTDQT
jgi:hypothetical protein